ncbi:hypothetical protein GCM10010095_84630 [Streptomyces anthocyanicus]|nr:hypothetical protein GCM10010095_84630 [Streptomyces anthocyanicus]
MGVSLPVVSKAESQVPVWREGLVRTALSVDFQRFLAVLAGRVRLGQGPLTCQETASAFGRDVVPVRVEGLRAKVKRLVARGWLAESSLSLVSGWFMLARGSRLAGRLSALLCAAPSSSRLLALLCAVPGSSCLSGGVCVPVERGTRGQEWDYPVFVLLGRQLLGVYPEPFQRFAGALPSGFRYFPQSGRHPFVCVLQDGPRPGPGGPVVRVVRVVRWSGGPVVRWSAGLYTPSCRYRGSVSAAPSPHWWVYRPLTVLLLSSFPAGPVSVSAGRTRSAVGLMLRTRPAAPSPPGGTCRFHARARSRTVSGNDSSKSHGGALDTPGASRTSNPASADSGDS